MLSFTSYFQIIHNNEAVVFLVGFRYHAQGDHLSGKPAKVGNLTAGKSVSEIIYFCVKWDVKP